MNNARLIPVLTLVGNQAIKTVKFENPRYVGDPVNTTALFSSFEVEELIILDISRSFGADFAIEETLTQIIENAFMPIAFGGGIYDFSRAKAAFDLGFDKVIIRSQLFKDNTSLQIAEKYGAQAITGCLDVAYPRNRPGIMIVNGQEYDVDDSDRIIEQVRTSGIGELVVQDIDRDGTRLGLRIHPLLKEAINRLQIPVVALGGCSDVKEASEFLMATNCHSIAASSIFLFRPTRDAILISYPNVSQWHSLIGESR